MAAIPIITPTPGRRAIAACGQLLLVSGGLVLLRLAMRVGVRGESIMIKSGHLARKFPACFALLVTAGLFTLVFSMLSPSFQTNDDTQMMMIASGKGIGLAPDEHIVFSNVVIGQVLKALYGAYPAIPWYGVYLYFVQYLAYSSLLYCVIVPGFTRWRLALYVLYFAGVGIFSLNNLQFTTVACVAGQSGTLACMTALRRRTASAESRVCGLLSVGAGMLVVASLIRLACIVPTILIAIPVAICWFGWPPRRAVLLPAATSAAACAVLVLGFAVYHNSYYNRDSKWQEFLRYNKLRAKFNDYGWIRYTPETASIFNAVCWSENDHAMIERWFYDDPVVYSEARLQRIVAANNWRTRSLMIEYVWRHVEMILRDKSLWPMFFLFPLFLWASARSMRNLLACCGSATVALVLLGVLAALTKPPPSRVYFPALTFPLAVVLVATREGIALPRRRWRLLAVKCFVSPNCWRRLGARRLLHPTMVHALLVLALVGVVMATRRECRRSLRVQTLRRTALECIATLEQRDDRLYVSWATGFPYEAISPLDNLMSLANLRLFMIGWPQRTPVAATMRRKFVIESVPGAVCQHREVFFFGNTNSYARFGKFIREHHGLEVRFVPCHDGGHEFDVVGRFEPSCGETIVAATEKAAAPAQR